MEINLKYKPGQRVWIVENMRIRSADITSAKVYCGWGGNGCENPDPVITYNTYATNNIPESCLFETERDAAIEVLRAYGAGAIASQL